MHSGSESYRPDIDGLRAVAVLAVIAFHAFPQWLPGGYVGVDVFFVISGFLISSQLIGAAESGTLSFSGFYARRIRRIFPALIVVLIATAVTGWFVLLPHEWTSLSRHVGASTIFANNLLLWSEAGYFDGPSELKPLLHLWSLGVEEQFYLLWPLTIWWLRRRNVRWSVAIAAVAILSFAINVVVVNDGAAAAAFFLPHTRLWQLATGAFLAALVIEGVNPGEAVSRFLYRATNADSLSRVNNLFSVCGIALIVLTTIALSQGIERPDWWSHGGVKNVTTVVHWIGRLLGFASDARAYPGWSAVAPTLGAALVIAAGPMAIWNRALLSLKPMVFIGLISYPLYLWHWPMLSFLQITEQGDVSRPLKLAAIVASIILATITYLFIERPIRRHVKARSLREIAPIAGSLAAVGVVMAVAITTGRLTPPARTALNIDTQVPIALNEPACRERFTGLGEYCQQFDRDLPLGIALLGDSHAAHFLPGLGTAAKAMGVNVVHLGQTGCPPLIGIERIGMSGDNNCVRVNRAVIDAVAADRSITEVWLSFRGALATTGLDIGERSEHVVFRSIDDGSTNADAIGNALKKTIALLQSRGKHVGMFQQVPELGFAVDQCTGRPVSLRYRPARPTCSIDRAAVMARQSTYRELIANVRAETGITVFDPLTTLCDEAACHAVADGHLLYFDDNHLGVYGSVWALRSLAIRSSFSRNSVATRRIAPSQNSRRSSVSASSMASAQ
jgi:peptidoglycan/LPS O-acetylase OafA/YrhL